MDWVSKALVTLLDDERAANLRLLAEITALRAREQVAAESGRDLDGI